MPVVENSGRSGSSAALLETLATEYGPPLGWLEGDRRILPARGTRGAGFHFVVRRRTAATARRAHRTLPLRLASLAALGFVPELLIVKK